MEDGLQRMVHDLQSRMSVAGGATLSSLMWGFGMKISTPNALRGVIIRVTDGAVNAEVVMKLGRAAEIVAVVTRQSVEDLGLAEGREAIALINAGSIILASAGEGPLCTSARNALPGTVVAHQSGAVNDEIRVEIDEGKILTATVTSESARRMALEPGARVIALVKASHVILAVN
jgi:molybdate transport system regulatory protein